MHTLSIEPTATLVALGLFAAFSLLLLGLTSNIRFTPLNWLMYQIIRRSGLFCR